MGTPLRLLPSPLRPANHTLKTPSPVRMGASSYFATPGGVPGTPLTESMQLTAWLRDTSAKTSAQARLCPPLLQQPCSRPQVSHYILRHWEDFCHTNRTGCVAGLAACNCKRASVLLYKGNPVLAHSQTKA